MCDLATTENIQILQHHKIIALYVHKKANSLMANNIYAKNYTAIHTLHGHDILDIKMYKKHWSYSTFKQCMH